MASVFEKLEAFNKGLLPAKVARKYKLLTQNPFSFFRGTNHLFYEELCKASLPESPVCWICGDLHIENFGTYKGDNRLVYFDLNDFDESILAPVNWELARVLTSILVGFDALKITHEQSVKACELFLKKYSKILADGNARYIEKRTASGIVKKFLRNVECRTEKELLEHRTIKKNGKLKLSSGKNKQLIIHKELKEKLIEEFKMWMKSNNQPPNDYKVLDARFRLAGTGSLGIRRYVFLIEKIGDPRRHRLIDMKQATPSSLKSYINVPQPEWESEAHRIITVQRMMQNIPPAQLSEINFDGASYLMQEMQPTKDRINFKMIQHNFKVVCSVIEDMGMLAASAHLRSVSRKGACTADELISFGQNPNWHAELIDYVINYKKKVIDDYKEFKTHLKNYKQQKKQQRNISTQEKIAV